jgi:hypothetical protein
MRYRNGIVSEEAAWKIFECLIRGALVLEEGHEGDPNLQAPHESIAHFDIKPSNSKSVAVSSTQINYIFRLTELQS